MADRSSIADSLANQIDWNAPPAPTLPPNPFNAPGYSFPARLASYANQRFLQPLWSAATLPGDIATGKTTMEDPEAQQRAIGLAAATTLPFGSAPEDALTAGAARRTPAVITRVNPTQTDIDAVLGSVAQTKGTPWPTAQNPVLDVSPAEMARTTETVPQTSFYSQIPRPESGAALPAKGRAQQIVAATPQLAERIYGDLQPLTDPTNSANRLTQFYSTSPVLDQIIRQGSLGSEEAQTFMRDWAGQGAATSPRTATPQNMRNSSYLLWRAAQDDPLTRAAWEAEGNRPGFPMMGMHIDLADAFRQGTENINTNPKPVLFREGWSGNQADVTADTHNIRSTLYNYDQLFPGQLHPGWFSSPEAYQNYVANGGFRRGELMPVGDISDTLNSTTKAGVPRQVEYGVMAEPWYQAAQKLGASPAAVQAGGWFNYGPVTGLRSPAKTLPDLLNDQIEHTSRVLGVSPQTILDWWARRKIPLAENTTPNLMASTVG